MILTRRNHCFVYLFIDSFDLRGRNKNECELYSTRNDAEFRSSKSRTSSIICSTTDQIEEISIAFSRIDLTCFLLVTTHNCHVYSILVSLFWNRRFTSRSSLKRFCLISDFIWDYRRSLVCTKFRLSKHSKFLFSGIIVFSNGYQFHSIYHCQYERSEVYQLFIHIILFLFRIFNYCTISNDIQFCSNDHSFGFVNC